MVNETIAAVNQTSVVKEIGAGLSYFFKDLLLPRFLEILEAPIKHPQMLWMTIPLILTMFMMMFYFSRYKKEELGWNTAVGNSLVLIFVGLDLIRNLAAAGTFSLANITSLTANVKILVALCILAEGALLFFADFTHLLPKRFAYFISSPVYVNLTAYIGLVVVYSSVTIDIVTLLAAAVLFSALCLLFFIMDKIIPESRRELKEIELDEKRREAAWKKEKSKKTKSKDGEDEKEDKDDWVEIKAPKDKVNDKANKANIKQNTDEDEEANEKTPVKKDKNKGFLSDLKKDK